MKPSPTHTESEHGQPAQLDDMLGQVYRELRALAYQLFQGQRDNHTLQPTALVHEAYLRLARQPPGQCFTREEFLGAAARMIRYILVDHARAKRRTKRGGGRSPVSLSEELVAGDNDIDVLELDEALSRLAGIDARKAAMVELRFFGGLTMEEIATMFETSPRALYRDWQIARAWLQRELSAGETS